MTALKEVHLYIHQVKERKNTSPGCATWGKPDLIGKEWELIKSFCNSSQRNNLVEDLIKNYQETEDKFPPVLIPFEVTTQSDLLTFLLAIH